MDFQNQVTWDTNDVISDISDIEQGDLQGDQGDLLDAQDLNEEYQQGTWTGRFLKISKSPTFGAFFGN